MRALTKAETEAIAAGDLSTNLALATAGTAAAATVTRFIPGAQLASGVLTLTSIGLGALAGAARAYESR